MWLCFWNDNLKILAFGVYNKITAGERNKIRITFHYCIFNSVAGNISVTVKADYAFHTSFLKIGRLVTRKVVFNNAEQVTFAENFCPFSVRVRYEFSWNKVFCKFSLYNLWCFLDMKFCILAIKSSLYGVRYASILIILGVKQFTRFLLSYKILYHIIISLAMIIICRKKLHFKIYNVIIFL